MKPITCYLLLLFLYHSSRAQFYYKDLVLTRQAAEKWKKYHLANVRSVTILSYDANDQPVEGFTCEEKVSTDFSQIATHTQSAFSPASNLICYYDKSGILQKSVDRSDRLTSSTVYKLEGQDRVITITNISAASDTSQPDIEEHQWEYDSQGKPITMLKIKNSKDSTYVRWVMDEKGNPVEEHAIHNKMELPVIYYYYDQENRLTDIVRFNEKAQRLLPNYIFEYTDKGVLQSMISIPEDSSDYLKWYYEYNEEGLRIKETCFNKQRQLLGRIEYRYILKK